MSGLGLAGIREEDFFVFFFFLAGGSGRRLFRSLALHRRDGSIERVSARIRTVVALVERCCSCGSCACIVFQVLFVFSFMRVYRQPSPSFLTTFRSPEKMVLLFFANWQLTESIFVRSL